MIFTRLGSGDLQVSKLGLGTWLTVAERPSDAEQLQANLESVALRLSDPEMDAIDHV